MSVRERGDWEEEMEIFWFIIHSYQCTDALI